METKHTSGPWDVEDVVSRPVVEVHGPNCELVARCPYIGNINGAANAHLIAAAPAMLEALENLLEQVQQHVAIQHLDLKLATDLARHVIAQVHK